MRLLVALLAVPLSSCTLGQAKLAAYAGVTADLATTQRALDAGARGGMAIWNISRIIKHHNHRPTPKAPPVSVGVAVRF